MEVRRRLSLAVPLAEPGVAARAELAAVDGGRGRRQEQQQSQEGQEEEEGGGAVHRVHRVHRVRTGDELARREVTTSTPQDRVLYFTKRTNFFTVLYLTVVKLQYSTVQYGPIDKE